MPKGAQILESYRNLAWKTISRPIVAHSKPLVHVSLRGLHFVFKLAPCGSLSHSSSFLFSLSSSPPHPFGFFLAFEEVLGSCFEEGLSFKLLSFVFFFQALNMFQLCFEEIGGGLLHDLDSSGLVNVGDGGLGFNFFELWWNNPLNPSCWWSSSWSWCWWSFLKWAKI